MSDYVLTAPKKAKTPKQKAWFCSGAEHLHPAVQLSTHHLQAGLM